MMMLLPVILQTPDSRIVLQSSEFHRIGTGDVRFNDVAEINQDIGPSKLYGRSKLAQVLMTRGLKQRKNRSQFGLKPNSAPWINATHPGAVVTDQQEQAVEAYGTMGKLGVKAVRPFMKKPLDEGCRAALFAATCPDVARDQIDGEYIVPDRKVTEVSKQARDEELAERCWKLVETVLHEKLGSLGYATTYV